MIATFRSCSRIGGDDRRVGFVGSESRVARQAPAWSAPAIDVFGPADRRHESDRLSRTAVRAPDRRHRREVGHHEQKEVGVKLGGGAASCRRPAPGTGGRFSDTARLERGASSVEGVGVTARPQSVRSSGASAREWRRVRPEMPMGGHRDSVASSCALPTLPSTKANRPHILKRLDRPLLRRYLHWIQNRGKEKLRATSLVLRRGNRGENLGAHRWRWECIAAGRTPAIGAELRGISLPGRFRVAQVRTFPGPGSEGESSP